MQQIWILDKNRLWHILQLGNVNKVHVTNLLIKLQSTLLWSGTHTKHWGCGHEMEFLVRAIRDIVFPIASIITSIHGIIWKTVTELLTFWRRHCAGHWEFKKRKKEKNFQTFKRKNLLKRKKKGRNRPYSSQHLWVQDYNCILETRMYNILAPFQGPAEICLQVNHSWNSYLRMVFWEVPVTKWAPILAIFKTTKKVK